MRYSYPELVLGDQGLYFPGSIACDDFLFKRSGENDYEFWAQAIKKALLSTPHS